MSTNEHTPLDMSNTENFPDTLKVDIELLCRNKELLINLVTQKVYQWYSEVREVKEYLEIVGNTRVKVILDNDRLRVLITSKTYERGCIAEVRLTTHSQPDYFLRLVAKYSPEVYDIMRVILYKLAEMMQEVVEPMILPLDFASWAKSEGVRTIAGDKEFSIKINRQIQDKALEVLKRTFSYVVEHNSADIKKNTYLLVDLGEQDSASVEISLRRNDDTLAYALCLTDYGGTLSAKIYNQDTDNHDEFMFVFIDRLFQTIAEVSGEDVEGVITVSKESVERKYTVNNA